MGGNVSDKETYLSAGMASTHSIVETEAYIVIGCGIRCNFVRDPNRHIRLFVRGEEGMNCRVSLTR